jgi:alanyl-tRNA synthetase
MSEELKPGEVAPIEQPKGLTAADVQAAIAEALEGERRKYQSKIDQILAEKKATESKAMTVEEQVAELKTELQRERSTAKRKEAKALAGFDDELDAALLEYADPDKASDAARKIKTKLEAEKLTLMAEIEDLKKRLQYGAKAPPAGKAGQMDLTKMTLDQINEYASQGEAQLAEVLAIAKSRR